jgi:ABC-type Zn uptake system ZnuABC Zn-binding protein ZnuA
VRRIFFAWIAILLLASCGPQPGPSAGTTAPITLTTTTILADITRNIAGDRLKVESLLPVGTDPHSYQPTPQDIAKVSKSKLMIVNGVGYETFLKPLLENAGGERTVIEASGGISPTKNGQEIDPHMWLDPYLVIDYVGNIRDALIQFDPEGKVSYESNAVTYVEELKKLDSWITEQVDQIPAEKRLLVTNHEAFGYFAQRYGFKVVGTVIESFSSDASPSAQQLAALVDQIKASKAPAIFLDASDNPTLAKQIAAETSVKVITDLHLESLTDGAPAATYMDMMKDNVTKIVNALK